MHGPTILARIGLDKASTPCCKLAVPAGMPMKTQTTDRRLNVSVPAWGWWPVHHHSVD
jgi:hypothetical protein